MAEEKTYEPMVTQKLLRTAEASKQLPAGDLIMQLADQLRSADAEISSVLQSRIAVDNENALLKRTRVAELEEMRAFRELKAAAPVEPIAPPPPPVPAEPAKRGRGRSRAVPSAPVLEPEQRIYNPFRHGTQMESPPPIVETETVPAKSRKSAR